MAGNFQFGSTFSSDNLISQGRATAGAGLGIDNPALFSMLGAGFHFDPNSVSIAAVALRATQSVALDLDFGGAGGIDNINTKMFVINSQGAIVASSDNSAVDLGSTSTVDPKLAFTAMETGVFYVVIAHQTNAYLDNTFTFDNGGTDTGDFTLNAGFAGLAARTVGTAGIDSVTLLAGQRRYDALGGDDTIGTSASSTIVDAGSGNDYIYAAAGHDTLYGGEGGDNLYGNNGNDLIVGGADSDYLYGNDGADVIYGGSGYDQLYGGSGNDTLHGEDGGSYMLGDSGNDKIYGGSGQDQVVADSGSDFHDGGGDLDYIDLYLAAGNARIDLLISTVQNTLAFGFDTFINFEHIYGGGFNDTLLGTDGNNQLVGRVGNDLLVGRGGGDNLLGDIGDDRLIAGTLAQNDTDSLTGGVGKDTMFGGGGLDYFHFNAATDSTQAEFDIIGDFSHAQSDRIYLFSVYSGTLEFKGSAAFDGIGQLRSIDMGAFQFVGVNLDGNFATNEMLIRVNTADALLAGDFVL